MDNLSELKKYCDKEIEWAKINKMGGEDKYGMQCWINAHKAMLFEINKEKDKTTCNPLRLLADGYKRAIELKNEEINQKDENIRQLKELVKFTEEQNK